MTCNDLAQLPDLPALEQLARALWRDGSVRGAALLVGAGFSKNAVRPSEDTPEPPLWSDLHQDLLNNLYPHHASNAPINSLRVAEEYRTYLGQAALDDFIRTKFPDHAWMPGPLHVELLEFPWSDVLTTNWDTLLERAVESVDIAYDVVRHETDLPHARSPRIVKLHGSVGDAGPLIFAEEDYRTYPAKHAAFVNLARQIFIENELCLLGFSGDDPNFLQWAGWVRDQLGGTARRIYLVGNLHLPHATRKYMEAHNIAPIDFAPILENVQEAERHMEATRLFFDALKREKPVPAHEWKMTSSDYPLQAAELEAPQRARADDAVAAEMLEKITQLLETDRKGYPGWLVCPRNLRKSLGYGGDKIWLLRKSVLDHFEPARRAKILYEFLWRRTVAFQPLDEPLVRAITEVLEASPSEIDPSVLLEFAIALMRHGRLLGDDDALDKWGTLIEATASVNTPARIEAQYQRCLRARDKLDLDALATGLEKLDSVDPVWRMRRAALCVEIGENVKATKLIKETAADLEKRHRSNRNSLWIKSCLGWADWLSRGTDAANFRMRTGSSRPREFKDLLIDPSNEIERIENAAEEIQSKLNEENIDIVPMFAAGHYSDASKSIHFGEDNPATILYELDQLIEAVGLPIRINNVGICGGTAISALKNAYERSLDWYVWFLRAIHSHHDKAFNRYFGRVAVAKLSREVIAEMMSIARRGVSFWFERIKLSQNPENRNDWVHAVDQLRLFLSALSRLTVRMSEDDARQEFERAVDLANDPRITHPWIIEALGDLARYAADAIPNVRKGILSFSAMRFPLSTEKGCNKHYWPQIVTSIWDATPDRTQGDAEWQHRVQQLIAAAEKGQPAREEAILRLTYLSFRKALTNEEKLAFGNVLWSEVDGESLPSGTGLLASTFPQLPSPEGIDAVERVRTRLFDSDLQALLALPEPLSTSAFADKISHLISLLNVRRIELMPNSDQASQLFDKLVVWNPGEVDGYDPIRASMIRSFTDALRQYIGEVLANVVVPAMAPQDRTEHRGRKLLDFVHRTKAWRSLPSFPDFVALTPSLIDDFKKAIRRGLIGSEDQHVSSAAMALVCWGKKVKEGILSELPRVLVEKLIATVEMRHEQGLHSLLSAVRSLLNYELLTPPDMNLLMQALSDLRIETQYDKIDLDGHAAVSVSLVRVECAKLALALQARVVDDGTLLEWIKDAKVDPLPEVRFSIGDTS